MDVVKLAPPLRFPKVCPRCCRMADSTRKLVLRSGGGWGKFLLFLGSGHATYDKHLVEVPYCSGCNQRFQSLRIALFLAIALPGFALLFFPGVNMREWPLPIRIAGAVAMMASFLSPLWWFWIRDRLSDLYLREVDPATGALALAVRNPDYAARLKKDI